ncbi:MAG: putative metal-dependent hydrolase [Cytophagales bacterium]|nr:MAG: putative metal-dependent hydrolase [Cytophagales bacterium]
MSSNIHNDSLDALRYPIGRVDLTKALDKSALVQNIQHIAELPMRLTAIMLPLSAQQIEKQYRADSWTIRQLAHHLADSHMNGYIRMKLAFTEDTPVIKPYAENLWAKTPDNMLSPLVSAELLVALHARWSFWLGTLSDQDFSRRYFHPEAKRLYTIAESVTLYAWHGLHHLEHIQLALRSA